MSAAPIIRRKNNPPPAEQIKDQLRTSSGVTFVRGGVNRVGIAGRQGRGAPAAVPLSAAVALPLPTPREIVASSGALMLRALYNLVCDGVALPNLHGLAEEIPEGTLRDVRGGLQFLCDQGQIAMATVGGSGDPAAGRVIRIIAPGWELRSANCPAWLKV